MSATRTIRRSLAAWAFVLLVSMAMVFVLWATQQNASTTNSSGPDGVAPAATAEAETEANSPRNPGPTREDPESAHDSVDAADQADPAVMPPEDITITVEAVPQRDQQEFESLGRSASLTLERLDEIHIAETGDLWLDGYFLDPSSGTMVTFTLDQAEAGIPDDPVIAEMYQDVEVDNARVLIREDEFSVALLAERADGTAFLSISIDPPSHTEPWSPAVKEKVIQHIVPGLLSSD